MFGICIKLMGITWASVCLFSHIKADRTDRDGRQTLSVKPEGRWRSKEVPTCTHAHTQSLPCSQLPLRRCGASRAFLQRWTRWPSFGALSYCNTESGFVYSFHATQIHLPELVPSSHLLINFITFFLLLFHMHSSVPKEGDGSAAASCALWPRGSTCCPWEIGSCPVMMCPTQGKQDEYFIFNQWGWGKKVIHAVCLGKPHLL